MIPSIVLWLTIERKSIITFLIIHHPIVRGKGQQQSPFETHPATNANKDPNNVTQVLVSSVIRRDSGDVKAVKFREKSEEKIENALVARRRVIRLLIAVVLTFAVCVLPAHLYQLWLQFGSGHTLSTAHKILPAITYLILYSNSALNPILYALLSDNFRKSLKDLLGGLKRKTPLKRNIVRSTLSLKTANTMI